jgi:benzoate-CoA ligase
MLTSDDYQYYLNDSQARTLVISENFSLIKGIMGELRYLRDVIVVDDDGEFSNPYQQMYAQASEKRKPRSPPKTMSPSGNTPRHHRAPKGAVHSHSDMQYVAEAYGKHVLGMTENDVCYSAARLFSLTASATAWSIR